MSLLSAFRRVKRHSNVILPTALLLLVISSGFTVADHQALPSQLAKENSHQSPGSSSQSAADARVASESVPASSSSVHEVSPSPVKAKSNETANPTESHNIPKAPSETASSGQAHSIVNTPEDESMEKKLNPEALMRAFYVFVGLSVIVMVYFAWKSFGKRPTQVHRYGVVANREDLEMAPLDSDDGEEDDTTHFDISKHRLQ